MIRLRLRLLKCAAIAVTCLLFASSVSFAQNANNGGNNNGGGNNGGGNNGGANNGGANNNGGGNAGAGAGGVRIDAQGVLRVMRPNHAVTARKLWAAKQALPQRLARPSKMRKISLNRLEKAVNGSLTRGENIGPEMIALAGLTRLEYVFFYPESGDIVIAGPAEGFAQDSVGRIVGVDSRQPTLLLDDLIVALRAYAPSGDPTNTISVSIDPTKEGLARMQKTLQQLGSNFRGARDVPVILNSLKQSLGLNEVTIGGISPNTHFAHVLTEADYRMKLIGIGLEPVPARGMVSYASQLNSANASSNALLRWFFVPDYNAVTTNADFTAMQLAGQGLKLIDENELVTSDGTRKASRRVNPASKRYTTSFTKAFPQVAKNDPVYGQLRNLVDLTIAAAFIQKQDFYGQCGWDLGSFASEDRLPVETLPAPQQVETAINAVMKGRRLFTPIGGGVAIQAHKALDEDTLRYDNDGKVTAQREAVSISGLDADQWWWD